MKVWSYNNRTQTKTYMCRAWKENNNHPTEVKNIEWWTNRTLSFYFFSFFMQGDKKWWECKIHVTLWRSSPKLAQSLWWGCTPVPFLAFSTWLGYGRSQMDLPSLVVTAFDIFKWNLGFPQDIFKIICRKCGSNLS